jgi:hypothetical protein
MRCKAFKLNILDMRQSLIFISNNSKPQSPESYSSAHAGGAPWYVKILKMTLLEVPHKFSAGKEPMLWMLPFSHILASLCCDSK